LGTGPGHGDGAGAEKTKVSYLSIVFLLVVNTLFLLFCFVVRITGFEPCLPGISNKAGKKGREKRQGKKGGKSRSIYTRGRSKNNPQKKERGAATIRSNNKKQQ